MSQTLESDVAESTMLLTKAALVTSLATTDAWATVSSVAGTAWPSEAPSSVSSFICLCLGKFMQDGQVLRQAKHSTSLRPLVKACVAEKLTTRTPDLESLSLNKLVLCYFQLEQISCLWAGIFHQFHLYYTIGKPFIILIWPLTTSPQM